MSLLALASLPFLSSPLVGWLGRRSSPLLAVLPFVIFVALLAYLSPTASGEAVRESYPWIPSLGIEAAFRLDGLSLTFALLISGIGALIFLYASSYLRGEPRLKRFYVVLTLFMGAMLGAVMADDLILLVVFWELTSLTSFLLIGYSPEDPAARRSAQQGLLVTVTGGLSMLAGVILLGSTAGTFSISEILQRGDEIAASPATPAIIGLIALGAFAKSAQAPLHSWLANAMVAPAPVSAYLHSATMVKLGVYVLSRLNPVYSEDVLWITLLVGFGSLTMLVGAILALRETDLKKVLAYSTIVSLGTLVILTGLPGELPAIAAMTFLVVHALYKACLFMVAGIVDHETGTRDSASLGGLGRAMPLTAAAAFLGGLSMAGLPPFLGFAAKELVYEAGLDATTRWLVISIGLFANAVMVVVAAIVAVRCFTGTATRTPKVPHDPPVPMLAGPLLLAMSGLGFGLAPWLIADSIIMPAASGVAGTPLDYKLTLWHGLTAMLGLSVLTLAGGIAIYRRSDAIQAHLSRNHALDAYGPDGLYDRLMDGIQRLAFWQTGLIQTGSLRVYVARTLIVIAGAAAVTLFARDGFAVPSFAGIVSPELALVGLLVVSALSVLKARNFISGIVAAGMVGFSVALIFLMRGAPDLAFTQFSVEALAVVIFLAIVGRMPFREPEFRAAGDRLRDGIVAAGLGITSTLVMLSVVAQPFDGRISDFFRASSVPEAHGRNLVNVIIVDFRALDTLGEIAVLGLAALAAAAVLSGLRAKLKDRSR